MGCDALGWIGVRNGKVVRVKSAMTTLAADEIISGLVGKNVSYWNPQMKPYFDRHLQYHK
jgi:hypothetical protein